MPTTFLPARYEFKYGLPWTLADQLAERFEALATPDPFTGTKGAGYVVRSLYFDDASMSAYYGKLSGIRQRTKLRIRSYENDSSVFLEVKAKEGPFVRKARLRLPDEAPSQGDGRRLLQWLRRHWRPTDTPSDREVWRQINWPGLRPVVLVAYVRRAFVTAGPSPVRLTLDHRIAGRAARRLEPWRDGRGLRPALGDQVILELKFRHTFPSWLTHLIERHELTTGAFSKYCLALETAAPLFDRSRRRAIVDEGLDRSAAAWLYHRGHA